MRLSHLFAIDALKAGPTPSDQRLNALLSEAFDEDIVQPLDAKLPEIIHKIHLVALKTNFELFLNRMLCVVWIDRFQSLAHKINKGAEVKLFDLGQQVLSDTDRSLDALRLVVDNVIPRYGLNRLKEELERTTDDIDLAKLPGLDSRYWPQIRVAFEVRNLVEHRDGRVDRRFRSDVGKVWGGSTWGARYKLDTVDRIPVEEEDVAETFKAMDRACDKLTSELVRWSKTPA